MLTNFEQRVEKFFQNKKADFGIVRVFRGEPQKITDAPSVYLWTSGAELFRTDEKYGRYVVSVGIFLVQANIVRELKRDKALELAHKVATELMKDPELRAGEPAGVALNLRIGGIRIDRIPGERGQAVQGVSLTLEAALDKVDINLTSY